MFLCVVDDDFCVFGFGVCYVGGDFVVVFVGDEWIYFVCGICVCVDCEVVDVVGDCGDEVVGDVVYCD